MSCALSCHLYNSLDAFQCISMRKFGLLHLMSLVMDDICKVLQLALPSLITRWNHNYSSTKYNQNSTLANPDFSLMTHLH